MLATAPAFGAIRPHAALCHNFGCFVTGQSPVLPFDPNLTGRLKLRSATNRAHVARLLLVGFIVFLLADLLVAGIIWGQWEANTLGKSWSVATATMNGNELAASATAPAPSAVTVEARPATRYLSAETASARLLRELAGNHREEVELPPIWPGNLRCTWFRQIGEGGRILYEAVLDPAGMAQIGDGTISLE